MRRLNSSLMFTKSKPLCIHVWKNIHFSRGNTAPANTHTHTHSSFSFLCIYTWNWFCQQFGENLPSSSRAVSNFNSARHSFHHRQNKRERSTVEYIITLLQGARRFSEDACCAKNTEQLVRNNSNNGEERARRDDPHTHNPQILFDYASLFLFPGMSLESAGHHLRASSLSDIEWFCSQADANKTRRQK